MLLKNLPAYKIFPVIFTRLVLDGIAGIYFLLKLGFPHIWAVVKSHFAFYTMAPETWKMRGKHQIKNYFHDRWIIFNQIKNK